MPEKNGDGTVATKMTRPGRCHQRVEGTSLVPFPDLAWIGEVPNGGAKHGNSAPAAFLSVVSKNSEKKKGKSSGRKDRWGGRREEVAAQEREEREKG